MPLDVAALSVKILASFVGPTAKFAWKKLRGDKPLINSIAKVASDAMAKAVLSVAEGYRITDEEIQHLGGLIGEAMEAGPLMAYVYEDRLAVGRSDAQDAVLSGAILEKMHEASWVDMSTTSLPVPEVLDRFIEFLPWYVRKEAARPGSLLFGPSVITSLHEVLEILNDLKEGEVASRAASTPGTLLREAADCIGSLSGMRIVAGLDLIRTVRDKFENGAELAVSFLCAALRDIYGSDRIPGSSNQEYEKIKLEPQLVRFLRDLLPVSSSPEDPYDLDLHGVTLTELDLSRVKIGRLTLNEASIEANLKLSSSVICDSASICNSSIGGFADFEGAVFSCGLSCRETYFVGMDFSGVAVAEGCNFDDSWFTGSSSFGVSDDSRSTGCGAEFWGDVGFNGAWVGESVDMGGISSHGSFSLVDASFCGEAAMRKSHFFEGLDMAGSSVVGKLDLGSAHVFGDLDLRVQEAGEISVELMCMEPEASFRTSGNHEISIEVDNRVDIKILRDVGGRPRRLRRQT